MRVLVCGGRSYRGRDTVFNELDNIHNSKKGIDIIICGGATGADSLAIVWAQKNGVLCHVHFASWEKLGKAAGPIRNERMLKIERPDKVLAFPGGAGTENMVKKARMRGYEVLEVG